MSRKNKELELNIRAFKNLEESLRVEHPGKYALMHHGEVVLFFNDQEDAHMMGQQMYLEGDFSVSPRIGASPESLGAAARYLTPVSVG